MFGISAGTALAAGAVVGGALIGADASRRASNTQADAAENNNALQKQIYDQNRADQMPWLEAGRSALDKLNALLADGTITSKFAGDITKEPGYAFAAAEGQRAIDNSASARGGIGGAALKAGARFAEDNANKFYGAAFDRSLRERQAMLDPLYRIAGFGTDATGANAISGRNYASETGANTIFGAQAGAQNALAQGNIYGNAINQLGALGQRQKWWNGGNSAIWDPSFESDPNGWTGQH
jgi:hypothetical protein